ncbi:MAG: hypothetical protein LBP68_00085 [Acidobacteriota bacterium]|jgi:hypothetical protein|nr:hypothetical protein [Acidobacteriota bacterium]
MTHCKNCIHWIDESLAEIVASGDGESHIFMGCKVFGEIGDFASRNACPRFVADPNLYTICSVCQITVPKICISLGECANCTDTDLFCVESCMGGDARKYCTHFVRLHTEGLPIVDKDSKEVYDLFPAVGMPGASEEPAKGESAKSEKSVPAKGTPILIDIQSKRKK